MATPEKIIEKQILDWFNLINGCFAFKLNNVGVYDAKKRIYRKPNSPHIHKGVPDIMGCYKSKFFAIEVKAGRGKPSSDQKIFMKRINECLSIAFWTNDFDKCKKQFVGFFGDVIYKSEIDGEVLLFEEYL